MKRTKKYIPAICFMPFLWGCASNQPGGQTWNIQPDSSISIKHAMSNPEAMYRMGRYYQGQKRYDQAIAAYQKALEADPKYVEALNGLGVIYSIQGKHAEAVAQFKAALDIDPNAGHVYNNLGYALYRQGDYAESVAVLEKATTLDSASRKTLNNLGMALAKTGSAEKSAQAFAAAKEIQIDKKPQTSVASIAEVKSAQVTVASSPDNAVTVSADVVQEPVVPVVVAAVAASDNRIESKVEAADPLLALPRDRGVIAQADEQPIHVQEIAKEAVPQVPSVSKMPQTPVAVAPVAEVKSAPPSVVSPNVDAVAVSADVVHEPATPTVVAALVPSENRIESRVEAADPALALPKDQGVIVQLDDSPLPLQEAAREQVQQLQPAKEIQERTVAVAERVASEAKLNNVTTSNQARVVPVAFSLADLKKWRVEISNGNGITGMARKVSLFLKKLGFAANRLTNQKPFRVATSRIYYRSGSLDVAQKIGASLPQQPQLIQSNKMRPDIQVRVVLGKDINKKSKFDAKRDLTVASTDADNKWEI